VAIIVDFSGTIHAAVFAAANAGGNTSPDEAFLRHIILGQVRKIRRDFSKRFGRDLVFAMDSRTGYWRTQAFPEYKHARREGRKASPMNWEVIFRHLNKITKELEANLPARMIGVDKAEADDVIAALVKERPFGDGEVLIISNDHDMRQLHGPDVIQWFPAAGKLEREESPDWYLSSQVVKGDPGDGVPNIFSPRDFFLKKTKGMRQPQVTMRRVQRIISGEERLDKAAKARLVENAKMVDLALAPGWIADEVVDKYLNYKMPSKAKLMGYMIAHNLDKHLANIGDF
jgi:hypothetical protein